MSNPFHPVDSATNVGDSNVAGVGIDATGDGVFISALLWNFTVNEALEFNSMYFGGRTTTQYKVFVEYLSDVQTRSPTRSALSAASRRRR
jgi:hypothetical protein